MSAVGRAHQFGAAMAEDYVLVERDSGRVPDLAIDPMTDWADPITVEEIYLSVTGYECRDASALDTRFVAEITTAFKAGFAAKTGELVAVG